MHIVLTLIIIVSCNTDFMLVLFINLITPVKFSTLLFSSNNQSVFISVIPVLQKDLCLLCIELKVMPKRYEQLSMIY